MAKEDASMAEHKTFNNSVLSATGVEGLDDVLGGGLSPNRLYLVEGNPGSGKTTLAIQYLLEGARRKEAGVYVTLSETKQELLAVAASHGWSLDDLEVVELVAEEKELDPDNQYTMFQPSEIQLGETTRARVRPLISFMARNGRPSGSTPRSCTAGTLGC
jgi:circadian clock protein KaiC